MSDTRWVEIEADFAGATEHFSQAASLFDEAGFDLPGAAGYRATMAFLHAMLAGYTSFESGLLRIMNMIGEDPPTGSRWHSDLIRRASRDIPKLRPAILPADVATAADEARSFRHVAVHAYDSFNQTKAGLAVDAARVLTAALPTAIAQFKAAIDGDAPAGHKDA